jgi:hypothetical protein
VGVEKSSKKTRQSKLGRLVDVEVLVVARVVEVLVLARVVEVLVVVAARVLLVVVGTIVVVGEPDDCQKIRESRFFKVSSRLPAPTPA